jgi:uncharacterized protein YndB with AHSA1/START domain
MTHAPTRTVTVETRVQASPATVFSYFTDPVKYRRWKGLDAELDPRPGGRYRVRMNSQRTVLGEYVVVEPPSRLVFTWGWEGDGDLPPGSSTVEITLIPDGDDTLVRLRHTGLPTQESRTLHAAGWDHYLGRLARAAAGRYPGLDPLAV